MSSATYQFAIFTADKWADVSALNMDIGQPRIGPESDPRYLISRNGNVPFDPSEEAALSMIGVEWVPSYLIEAWLESNGWNAHEAHQ